MESNIAQNKLSMYLVDADCTLQNTFSIEKCQQAHNCTTDGPGDHYHRAPFSSHKT